MTFYKYYKAWPIYLPCTLPVLEKALNILANNLGINEKKLEIYLVNDAFISQKNMRHMGCVGPTNVLTFPEPHKDGGSLILSLDTFSREAFIYGQRAPVYLYRLITHGMIHLAGFEHGPKMWKLQDKYLKQLQNLI